MVYLVVISCLLKFWNPKWMAVISAMQGTVRQCSGMTIYSHFCSQKIKNIIKIQLRDALKHQSLFDSQIFIASTDSLDVILWLNRTISTIYILSMLFWLGFVKSFKNTIILFNALRCLYVIYLRQKGNEKTQSSIVRVLTKNCEFSLSIT